MSQAPSGNPASLLKPSTLHHNSSHNRNSSNNNTNNPATNNAHNHSSSSSSSSTSNMNVAVNVAANNGPTGSGGGGGGSSNNSNPGGTPGTHQTNGDSDDSIYFPYCDDVNKYEKIGKIGQGTFGEVFKARHLKTKKLVALKKVLMENEKEGFPITALREIKILQLLKHENVVNLIEICRTSSQAANYKATFYLVFDFCEHDLAGLLSNVNLSLGEIKKVMQQLLNGLFFIHKQKILHRDMKAANILISKAGVLKLADFGLARAISEVKTENRYTNRVVTLWYRPPELLLGARNYGPPIDLWGAGCIMAEMWTRTPILQGSTEQQQLTLISQLCGSLTPEVWPGVEKLELYNKLELIKNQRRRVKERLKVYVKCNHALDLLDKLLILDPSKRLDSDSALNHDFFWSDPMPADLGIMLSHYNNSMFEFTTSRRRQNLPQPGGPPGAAGPIVNPHPPFHPGPGGHHQGGPGRPGVPPGAGAANAAAAGGQYMDRVF